MDDLKTLKDSVDQIIIDARSLAMKFQSAAEQSAMDEIAAIMEEAKDILDHWEEDYENNNE